MEWQLTSANINTKVKFKKLSCIIDSIELLHVEHWRPVAWYRIMCFSFFITVLIIIFGDDSCLCSLVTGVLIVSQNMIDICIPWALSWFPFGSPLWFPPSDLEGHFRVNCRWIHIYGSAHIKLDVLYILPVIHEALKKIAIRRQYLLKWFSSTNVYRISDDDIFLSRCSIYL